RHQGGARLFRQTSASGSTRREFRPRLRQTRGQDAGRTTSFHRGARLQMRRAVGNAGWADARLCDSCSDSSGRVRASSTMTDTVTISAASKPVLPKGVRLTENPAQGWVLVAPERVFKADNIAVTILKRCDGVATVAQMAEEFAAAYKAPRERI